MQNPVQKSLWLRPEWQAANGKRQTGKHRMSTCLTCGSDMARAAIGKEAANWQNDEFPLLLRGAELASWRLLTLSNPQTCVPREPGEVRSKVPMCAPST